jgi:hypothetical protein
MPKQANAKVQSAAEQGLEDLIEMESTPAQEIAPEEASANDGLTSASELASDDEMDMGGGAGARIDVFFSHTEYEKMNPLTDKTIQEGDTFDGEYLGSMVSGQYKSRKHKIRPTSGPYAGKVIGLPPCTKLNDEYQFVPEGTRTIARYDGRATKAEVGPDWTGQLPYRYSIGLPKQVKAAIKAGTLPKNYEVHPKKKS